MRNPGTILFTREVRWNSTLPVSTRMLAGRFLAHGWSVIWVNPVASGPWLTVERTPDLPQGLIELRPMSPVPTSFRTAAGVELRHIAAWRVVGAALRHAIGTAGFSAPDVLWLSHIKSLGVERLFPRVPRIWHVTDDYAAMSRFPDAAARMTRAGLRTADRVACVSSALREELIARWGVPGARAMVLPHGVEATRLERPVGRDPFEGIGGPRVVYVGNTKRMDTVALETLARCTRAQYILIGDASALGEIGRLPNVHLMGPQPAQRVGELLPWCDAGWISYSPKELALARLGNPMKAMEYAAAGLPILSPPLPAYRDLAVPVRIYQTTEQLVQAIGMLPPSASEREAMREPARAHTWDARYTSAMSLIEACSP